MLGRDKDELLVRYAMHGIDSNLFVAKYQLYLPNLEELRRLVQDVVEEG